MHQPKKALADARPQSSFSPSLQRARHARYFEPNTVYHVIFRTVQGLYLLKPDAKGDLRSLIAGILARARKTFPGVRNHATVVLSNHGHLAISGDVAQLAAYVGFIKREISRRWGPRVGWRGLFEEGYHATAVITPAAQRACVKYIVAQSVKEGLVAHPNEWPGFHCAEALVSGKAIVGEWLDGTQYGAALQRAKLRGTQAKVRRRDFVVRCEMAFDKLPYLEAASDEEVRREMTAIVDEVVCEAEVARGGSPVVGPAKVVAFDVMKRSELPHPPWFVDRRRMVVWDNHRALDVVTYLERYREFQTAFRDAAERWRTGDRSPAFPAGAFWPGLATPIRLDLAA